MSSTTNNVGAMLTYMQKSTAAVSVSSITELSTKAGNAANSFSNVLNKTSDALVQAKDNKSQITDNAVKQGKSSQGKDVARSDDSNGSQKAIGNCKNSTDNLQNKQSTDNVTKVDETNTKSMEADEKLQEAIGEAGKELVSKMAEALDISEEDILSAMEILGLMAGDLLNPENVQLLVTEVIGEDKALDLLTDTDLYATMQDLMEGADSMRSELLNEFDLSEEDLEIALESLDDDLVALDGPKKEMPDENAGKVPEIIVNEAGDDISKDMKAPQSKEQMPEIKAEAGSEEVETAEFKPVEETNDSSNNHKETKGGLNESGQNANLFNQLINNITDAVDSGPVSTVSYTDRAQMENIIRQITEKITISAGNGETSMELQLHPAHLGNVNILLTSTKDGIVAKFTAQNELVKEAVESQMVALQQKFDAQGVKVTAIEVTIASHAFEQNLEQNQQGHEYEQAEGRFKKPLRRINLSEISEFEEEDMSEEELIAAKVMEMNGNTVDYSA